MKLKHALSLIAAAMALLALTVQANASKLDNRMESSARKSYVFTTYLQGDDIRIQSKDGAVTLTGSVSENLHKSLAQETVAALPGVKVVDNRLEVKGEPPAANTDAWLRDKVKVTLLFHSSVRALPTGVEAKDGIVILRGEAASPDQKELTTKYTKDVEGVQGVINEMSVAKHAKKSRTQGRKIDDASITAQVKLTMVYNLSANALHTKIETKNGVVTLYGKGANKAELDLAGKLAKDVIGVQIVKNRMAVE